MVGKDVFVFGNRREKFKLRIWDGLNSAIGEHDGFGPEGYSYLLLRYSHTALVPLNDAVCSLGCREDLSIGKELY